jgi:hypothetical protein
MRIRLSHLVAAMIAAGCSVIAMPAGLAAQESGTAPAMTFAELQPRMRSGDTLWVTSTAGDELRARLESVDVTRDLLLVSVNGIPLDLPARGIRTIHVEQRDPLTNGALIGVAHGLGAALLLTAISKDDTAGRKLLGFSLLTVPLGAGLGAAIDSVHQSRQLAYRPDRRASNAGPGLLRGGVARRLSFSLRFVW